MIYFNQKLFYQDADPVTNILLRFDSDFFQCYIQGYVQDAEVWFLDREK
jgi:hypothetical protein